MHKTFTMIVAVFGLYGVKINLLPFAGTSFRPDDILIFLYCISILLITVKGVSLPFPLPVQWMFWFVLWSLSSVVLNIQRTEIDFSQGVLFSLRNCEYAVFFFVGYFFHHYRYRFSGFIRYYLYYSILVSLLITFDIMPGFSNFSNYRLFSNTGGPYEFAVISGFMVFYFIKAKMKSLGGAAAIMLYFTLSRVTLVAALLILSLSRLRYFLIVGGAGIVAIVAVNVLSVDFNMIHRITMLADSQTLAVMELIVDSAEGVTTSADYLDFAWGAHVTTFLASLGGDVSSTIRLSRWMTLLYSTFDGPVSAFIGLGPSFASISVDGNYIRLLAETGIVGLVLYCCFLVSLICFAVRSRDWILLQYVLLIMLSAVFIDVFAAYKIMMLLWFYYGYSYNSFNRSMSQLPASRHGQPVARTSPGEDSLNLDSATMIENVNSSAGAGSQNPF